MVHLIKAIVFPVVMYGCESWTIKKADHQRTDAFELWCWRRLLRVPWMAWRFNQSILKKNQFWIFTGRTDAESWSSSTLATWCKELTHWKRPWCWERLKAGGEGDDRGWDGWMASLTPWTWVWIGSGSWWWTEKPGVLQSVGSQRVGCDWAELREQLLFSINSSHTVGQESNLRLQEAYWGGYTKFKEKCKVGSSEQEKRMKSCIRVKDFKNFSNN